MKYLTIISSFALLFLITIACTNTKSNNQKSTEFENSNNNPTSLYDFTMNSIDGKTIPLSNYKGKVLVIVNTASKCGLTPQYGEIEAFYNKYKNKGVEVLGFPANNFLSQEPGNDKEIAQFCTLNYGVSFQMFSKISVKGKDIHPLYQYLTQKEINGVMNAPVSWNFQKFIVDKNGNLITYFSPKTTVTNAEFLETIDSLLTK